MLTTERKKRKTGGIQNATTSLSNVILKQTLKQIENKHHLYSDTSYIGIWLATLSRWRVRPLSNWVTVLNMILLCQSIWAEVGDSKEIGSTNHHPLGLGMADPYKHAFPWTDCNVKFGCLRSNGIGECRV